MYVHFLPNFAIKYLTDTLNSEITEKYKTIHFTDIFFLKGLRKESLTWKRAENVIPQTSFERTFKRCWNLCYTDHAGKNLSLFFLKILLNSMGADTEKTRIKTFYGMA